MPDDLWESELDGLTIQEKITALVEFGLAETRPEARSMLIDMGEIDGDE